MSGHTIVEKLPGKYVIFHDGVCYQDKLKSFTKMLREAQAKADLHRDLGHASSDPKIRAWHFGLRANAEKRVSHWLYKTRKAQ